MKIKKKLVGVLAITLLSNAAMPSVYAANQTDDVNAPVVYATEERTVNEVNSKLDCLSNLIKGIKDISDSLTDGQLNLLNRLENAFDFIDKIVNKKIGNIKELRTKIIPRIDLLINVAETITADATELNDSEQEAHVIIGFSVTRAMLKATDIFETADGLNKASEDLSSALERAREIPKQTENSVRTHYNLDKLNRALSRAKNLRNRELKNKLDPSKLAEIDIAIRKTDNVRRNTRATVLEVKNATEELDKIIDEAYLAIPDGERVANNDTKLQLEKDIQIAKNLRDYKLKGNVDSAVIRELNREISIANRVLNNNKSTVNQVVDADETIVQATQVASEALDANDEEVVEEPTVVEYNDEAKDSTETEGIEENAESWQTSDTTEDEFVEIVE